ncbi:Calcium-binding protein SPEC 1A, partial [Orchesella cincta]
MGQDRAGRLDFDRIDIDGNGTIELEEIKTLFPPEHHDRLTAEFREADRNRDGRLDRREFRNLWQRKAYWFAKVIVQPKNLRGDSVDGAYADEYSCFPTTVCLCS